MSILVAVTGTPGAGKSTLAKALADLGFTHIDMHDLIKHYRKIVVKYDRKSKSYVINVKILTQVVKTIITKHEGLYVFDTHIAHLLPKELVDLVVVMRCSSLKKLTERLSQRNYHAKKIRENLDCEIFDECFDSTVDRGHMAIMTFDSGKRDSTKKQAQLVFDQLFE